MFQNFRQDNNIGSVIFWSNRLNIFRCFSDKVKVSLFFSQFFPNPFKQYFYKLFTFLEAQKAETLPICNALVHYHVSQISLLYALGLYSQQYNSCVQISTQLQYCAGVSLRLFGCYSVFFLVFFLIVIFFLGFFKDQFGIILGLFVLVILGLHEGILEVVFFVVFFVLIFGYYAPPSRQRGECISIFSPVVMVTICTRSV